MLFSLFFATIITTGLGAVPIENRILGGALIRIEDAPYQVAILGPNQITAAGVIVSKNVIATVGILAVVNPPSQYRIRAGSTFSDKDGVIIGVEKMIAHDKYTDIQSFDYSISLLKLVSSLDLNGVTIAAIPMAPAGFFMPDDAAPIATGYGAVTTTGHPLQMLQALAIPLVNQETCKEVLKPYVDVTDRMLCAKGRGSPCHLDGGGPFVWNKTLVGITSWNNNCGVWGEPSLWTRVSAVSEWAEKKIALWT